MDENAADQGGLSLVHDRDRDRFEALSDAAVVGVLSYGDEPSAAGTVRDFRSTVVSPERSGEGIGARLVRFALDDARRQGLRVRGTCWFVSGWLDRHPEYADLRADGGPSHETTGQAPEKESP